MTARFLIGDVRERMVQIPDASFDVIITSPPFLALRSYLPSGHPGKAQEIGSEATPADFLDVLLDLTAEWGRLLAPHGSLVVELGDTYSGSGGAGGDYNPDGLRAGQERYDGTAARARYGDGEKPRPVLARSRAQRPGWPLDKSLCGIPQAYQLSLTYGRNVLSGESSPAGMWRVRNLKPWIRSNPPVGALGDKERPATSYVVVATRARDRYFDLDAVRTPAQDVDPRRTNGSKVDGRDGTARFAERVGGAPAGAPPRDWWHHVDAVLDAELDRLVGKPTAKPRAAAGEDRPCSGKEADEGRGGNWATMDRQHDGNGYVGARGVHLRRALERAGILRTLDALDVSPKGYSGAHYAVWPTQLVRLLLAEMCPRRVCTVCGRPSRRIVEAEPSPFSSEDRVQRADNDQGRAGVRPNGRTHIGVGRRATTLGWSDCGHDAWRPGRVLDPFAGSGTTLEVASGMGYEATGIDIDLRNALLALDRVGPLLLAIDWPPPDYTLPTLPAGSPHPADYAPWVTDQDAERVLAALVALAHDGAQRSGPEPGDTKPRRRSKAPVVLAGQVDMFNPDPQAAA